MKFTDIILENQKIEKRIIIARCGVFMVAIGRDALLLNKLLLKEKEKTKNQTKQS